jgi:hypothetical protein
MRTRTGAALTAAALALGGCASAGHARPTAAPPVTVAAIGNQAPGPSASQQPSGHPVTSVAPAPTRPTAAPGPVLGGIKPAPPLPPGDSYVPDSFDRRARLPPGAVRVLSGHPSLVDGEWRLYAWRDSANHTCLHFAEQSAAGGGAGGTCAQKPPLDRSGDYSVDGRFLFGVAGANVTTVRVEHQDGAVEQFGTVSAPTYSVLFWAGEITSAPITRVAALDANGRVVAETTDNSDLNYQAPSGP